MVSNGCFIVFEGIDGSGKSTQRAMLAKYLQAIGKKVHLTQEPSDGACGVLLRQALQGKSSFDEATMALLFAADRKDHLNRLMPYFQADETILCDRHLLSSLAYNGDPEKGDWLLAINAASRQMRQPDLTIFLDIEPSFALQRIEQRGEHQERYEYEEKLTAVRANYLYWLNTLKIPHIIIDGRQPTEVIQEQIRRHLLEMNI